MSLETIKEITLAGGESGGADWNTNFDDLFQSHCVTISIDNNIGEGEEQVKKEITFNKWKLLLPSLFETNEEKKNRMNIEFKAHLEKRAEGNIIINYQTYNEEFPISKNSITTERIDEDYGLTDGKFRICGFVFSYYQKMYQLC